MKHLIICREYPPAPGGGIGTYVLHISRLLAESGETVHVIGQLWEGAEKKVEEKVHGRLIIHRIPFEDWTSFPDRKLSPEIKSLEEKGLFESSFHPQCFSWEASLLAESLVEQEGIDIIEAQEYEAPLYYFQLRRALGFGPKKYPPCIVHLHSPTEFIAQHNDWDIYLPDTLTAKRLEDYSIATADALLCPSRYLARQVESCYGLKEGAVYVIPYPMGESPLLERNKKVWEQGTVCYVGRLERRKGIIEWIDAAVTVASKYPDAYFEFVGANVLGNNVMSGEEFVKRRIPDELKMRFHFRGQQNRSSLPQFLAGARIAVVPSRWENFPNTCIEAMGSGLPVIASREGGMAEMIVDGKTGWLAGNSGSMGLAEALQRALETPPAILAEMGRNASSDIKHICDNKKIVESHLDFRRRIVNQGAKRSLRLPVNLPRAKSSLSDGTTGQISQNEERSGIAIVVTCFNTGQFLNECLQSIKRQTKEPAAVVIIDDKSTEEQTLKVLNKAQHNGWHVIQKKNGDLAPANNTGIETILGSEANPLGLVFLRAEDRLKPNFIAACESVLQQCPEVGLVSCWTQHYGTDDKIWIRPCPSFPYQWVSNDAAPFSAVRTEVLQETGYFRSDMSDGYDTWDIFNAVMAAGWAAVTVPEILGNQWVWNDQLLYNTKSRMHGRMRRKLLERFPDLVARDAKDIILLFQSSLEYAQWEEIFTIRKHLRIAQRILRSPLGKGLRVAKKIKNKIRRHAPDWMIGLIYR
ncbi:MAG: glycosyltransferase [Candidatus Brocadia sp.]|jgi:glycosyltransferase involved in cell wall biosynthesis/GT2 family glycosyltransferase